MSPTGECPYRVGGFGGMRRLHRARWAGVIGGLLDDELDPVAFERALRHVEECSDCLHELEHLARMQRSLSRLTGIA